MTKFTAEQKEQIKNQLINELSQSTTLDVIGGKLGTKKYEILLSAYALIENGLAIKVKSLWGGVQISITESGKEYAKNNIPVQTLSPAQKARQITRVNGKYSEMTQCDICLKRYADGVYYDDDLNCAVCDKCRNKQNK